MDLLTLMQKPHWTGLAGNRGRLSSADLPIQQEGGPVSHLRHSHIFISHLEKNKKDWRWTSLLDGTETKGGHSEMLETKTKESVTSDLTHSFDDAKVLLRSETRFSLSPSLQRSK